MSLSRGQLSVRQVPTAPSHCIRRIPTPQLPLGNRKRRTRCGVSLGRLEQRRTNCTKGRNAERDGGQGLSGGTQTHTGLSSRSLHPAPKINLVSFVPKLNKRHQCFVAEVRRFASSRRRAPGGYDVVTNGAETQVTSG